MNCDCERTDESDFCGTIQFPFFAADGLGGLGHREPRLGTEFHTVGRDFTNGNCLVADLLLAEMQPALDAHFLAFD